MAIQGSNDERYCHLTFRENGKVFSRRIHRIELQDRRGHLWIIKGRSLPDAITLDTGPGFVGNHIAEILLNPAEAVAALPAEPAGWPGPRDALNWVGAIAGYHILFAVVDAIAGVLP